MANIVEPEFDPPDEAAGFVRRRARVGRQAGAERLGASLYELEPGETAWPYHFHFGNEELLVVLRGRPHLRTPDGWRELSEGDVVAHPAGRRGAHQVTNRSDGPVRFLVVSEMVGPDVVVYPDTEKVAAREAAPGALEPGEWRVFRMSDAVDYWEGEQAPRE
jgi:uncharacterized cupin superfamily protein